MNEIRQTQDEKEGPDNRQPVQGKIIAALLVCGLGVGWLIGLSISPVVATVVAGLVTVLVALAGALVGLEQANSHGDRASLQRFNPVPLTALVVGIVAGSGVGITARANAWLSPSVDQVARKWQGIDRSEIRRRLFDQSYPPAITGGPGAEPKSFLTGTTLFSASDEECDRFRAKQGEDLRTELRSSVTSPAARRFAEAVAEPAALKAAVEIFICAK